MRIVEQPGDLRSIYEDETVFELAPDFCANCIRASLFSICPNLLRVINDDLRNTGIPACAPSGLLAGCVHGKQAGMPVWRTDKDVYVPEMPAIGITGGISTGKSTFVNCLRELLPDAKFFDADAMARQLTHHDQAVLAQIREKFGNDVFDANGQLNRSALRAMVFQAPEKRRELEQILHPPIRQHWSREAEKHPIEDVGARAHHLERFRDARDAVGVAGLVENMPSGKAQKPSGKSKG